MAGEEVVADEKGIKETLARIFKEMVEIRVITAVGDVTVRLRKEHAGAVIKTDLDTDEQPITDALVTIFDLLDGDVTNVISPTLREDQVLRAFHSAQVEKSLLVLPDNIRALVELGKALIDELR